MTIAVRVGNRPGRPPGAYGCIRISLCTITAPMGGMSTAIPNTYIYVQLHCDSYSVIYLKNNQVYHAKTKHIDVSFYKIKRVTCT
ncbi:hypothetical protein MTR_2g082760 [Medicago truncatula]|uniref:Uncharacterized protein n=1 Tax=Medicago truncatula TaxID=3880 RepID=G7IHE7_MEDTR|nr:hypothetical protein MTR_2g082760 [Medicago truncatula]